MDITISLAQMSLKFGDEKYNFEHAAELIDQAAANKSDLVLLPELWASGYDLPNWREYATPLGEGIFKKLKDIAKKNSIVVGSSLLELQNNSAYNTFVLIGKNGETLAIYRKIHRFRLLNEEKWLNAGDDLGFADTPWGLVGLSICYDLRFPEMFRIYAKAGVKLILIVAEWPERRVSHWIKLIQARAIENQLFIAGVNKVGESSGVKLGGRSTIVDPWGNPLIEGGDEEFLYTVTINMEEVDKVRSHIPVFRDRRPDVYARGEEFTAQNFQKHDENN
jgi:omega-amidase